MEAALGTHQFAAMQSTLTVPPLRICVRVNTLRTTPQVWCTPPQTPDTNLMQIMTAVLAFADPSNGRCPLSALRPEGSTALHDRLAAGKCITNASSTHSCATGRL